jgi:hypothetical protein
LWAADAEAGPPIDAHAELTEQARRAPPQLAAILRIVRERLDVQDSAAGLIGRSLGPIIGRLTEALRAMLTPFGGETVADTAARMRLDADTVGALLRAAGLDELIDATADAQVKLADLTEQAQVAGGIKPPLPASLVASATAAAAAMAAAFWTDVVERPLSVGVMSGLKTAVGGVSAATTMRRIDESLRQRVPSLESAGRTAIAEYDRQVTGASAARAGVGLFAYLGPVDRITRPFCATLADAVYSADQIGKMDNAQTTTSPLISGGGYNCRHQFAPISATLAEAVGIRMGLDSDVRLANRRARARR